MYAVVIKRENPVHLRMLFVTIATQPAKYIHAAEPTPEICPGPADTNV